MIFSKKSFCLFGLALSSVFGIFYSSVLMAVVQAQVSIPQVRSSAKPIVRSASNADVIDKSQVLRASLDGKDALHRFAIDVPRYSIVSATVSAINDMVYPLVRLKDVSGSTLKSPVAFNRKSASLGIIKLDSGKAFLEVFSQGGRTGSYLLEVSILDREHVKKQVVELTNAARQRAGLQPLVRHSLLDQAAQSHVRDMDLQDAYLAHTGSQGTTPEERIRRTGYQAAWVNLKGHSRRTIRLENAATGWTTAAEVVGAWLASPGHKAAMMDPETKEIGVGFEYDNENATTYWVQKFGYPWRPGLVQWF